MKTFRIFAIMLVVVVTLSACGTGGAGDILEGDLVIEGSVNSPRGFSEAEVRGMEAIEAVSKNKDGEEKTYQGVPLIALLQLVDVDDTATKVIFIGEEDSRAEVSLADLNACVDCIVSFRNNGGFSVVMPGFPKGSEVKGLTRIIVE